MAKGCARIRLAPEQRGGEPFGASSVAIKAAPGAARRIASVTIPVPAAVSRMAAGRPLVVTPRVETGRVVEQVEAGLVASGDRAEDLAEALLAVLSDPERAARLGSNGRAAVERDYDWRVIGGRLADELLRRVDS